MTRIDLTRLDSLGVHTALETKGHVLLERWVGILVISAGGGGCMMTSAGFVVVVVVVRMVVSGTYVVICVATERLV